LKNNHDLILTRKEKMLFVISIILLSIGVTFPIGLTIFVMIIIKIGVNCFNEYSRNDHPNTYFVN
jgi:hypothetical protein